MKTDVNEHSECNPLLSGDELPDDVDYKALFRRCAAVMGWGHLVDSDILRDRIPVMMSEQYRSLKERAFRNGSDFVSLAVALDAECTEPGDEGRLAAVMMKRIEELKDKAR